MKSFKWVICGLFPLIVLLWFSSSNGAERNIEFGKNFKVPLGCGCSKQDETDLNSRMKSIEAMINEYNALKPQYSGSKQTLTAEIRATIQSSVNAKRLAAKDPNAKDYGANTSDLTCGTTIEDAATPCLRGAVDDHEKVHRDACKSHKGTDWRYNQLVVDYMQEEINGYQKEWDRLQQEVNKMQAYCSLDPSLRQELEQMAAQQQRLKEAADRVEGLRKVLR
jgi:hypothetical protein